ncbi:UNVERIFIED_CONTAM: hypothetical protein Sradi_2722500 [Sesamum radiatum]|uniref:Helicase protein MOM1 n=1 Tax=Sesamum radiatum TaxID=300843 RepID=A0AAW2S7T9_SESRA
MLGQHVEDRNPSERFCPEENNVAPSITSTSTLAEALGCGTPVGNLASVNSQNEVRLMSLERSSAPMVDHLDQPTNSSDNGKSGLQDIPPPVEHVSDEIQSVDLSGEYQLEVLKTVPSEVVEHVHPVELSNAFKNGPDKGRKIALADDSVGPKDGPDGAVSEGLQNSGELLVHSEQTVVVPDCAHLLPQQKHQNLSTLVEASELVDTVTPLPSNLEAPVTDDILTTIPSNHEAPVTENTEHLHSVSVVSLCCNQSPATEDNDQGIPSTETVEPGGIEVLSHNSISQSGENLEIHGNHLDIRPVTSVARGQSVEVSPTPQNDVAIPQAVATTAEQLNQGVLPLGMDSVRFHVPRYHHAHPTHQPTLWNATPCLLTDPLQNELERMRKETELLEINHEDKTSQLKSDCEKEIQEMITQIRKKYEVKLQESEAAFRLKRNELDKNQTKVLMNKILAEAFRSKCLDVRPPGLPGPLGSNHQLKFFVSFFVAFKSFSSSLGDGAGDCVEWGGAPSSFMQHLHWVSLPPSLRSYPVAPACQPAPRQQITMPAVQTMQQLPPAVQTMPRPCSVRPSQVVGQNVASPPVQVVQNAAALFSGTSSRPPVISAITPARNPHATATSTKASLTSLVSQNGTSPHGGLPTPPNPSPSTVRMVMDMDHQPPVPRIRTSSPLPEICSTFRSLELSDLESLGDVQGNQTSAVATDVVCLSDDD